MQEPLVFPPVRSAEIISLATTAHVEAEERRKATGSGYLPLDPDTILVSLLLPIGDTLLATPALAALRRQFPHAKITVLVQQSNAGILFDNPNLDEMVYVTERGRQGAAKSMMRSVSEIRQKKYDLVVNFSPVGTFILWMAGKFRKRLRVEMPALWWLVGGHSETFRLRHAVDHYLNAISPILEEPPSPDDRQPHLYLTARDRTAARRILRERSLSPANLLVTMHVGGEGFNGRKRWASERFAAVARHLADHLHAHILLIGGKDDEALAEEVHARVPEASTVLAGRTTLKESGALIEMSALFIGNDSCPLHMSAAVGTPAVGIFGPSNYQQFHPIGKSNYRQRIVHSNLACSPCFNFIGNDAPWLPNTCYSRACLNSIMPEDVVQAAMELLQDPRER